MMGMELSARWNGGHCLVCKTENPSLELLPALGRGMVYMPDIIPDIIYLIFGELI